MPVKEKGGELMFHETETPRSKAGGLILLHLGKAERPRGELLAIEGQSLPPPSD
jgi:hypothetical protein